MHDLKEELGDLLLQVVYHARMAEEQGAFAFADVADGITAQDDPAASPCVRQRRPSGLRAPRPASGSASRMPKRPCNPHSMARAFWRTCRRAFLA